MSSPQNPLSRGPGGQGALPGQASLVCPACQHAVQRRPRRMVDRVLALWLPGSMPLRRYACTDRRCGWQGLLRGYLPQRPGYLPQQWL